LDNVAAERRAAIDAEVMAPSRDGDKTGDQNRRKPNGHSGFLLLESIARKPLATCESAPLCLDIGRILCGIEKFRAIVKLDCAGDGPGEGCGLGKGRTNRQ
jgi:hypothetical protein